MCGARPFEGVEDFTRMALPKGFVSRAHLSNLNGWAVFWISQRTERRAFGGPWAGMIWGRAVALFRILMGPAYRKNMLAIAHPSVNGRIIINKQLSTAFETEGAAQDIVSTIVIRG